MVEKVQTGCLLELDLVQVCKSCVVMVVMVKVAVEVLVEVDVVVC